MQMNGGRRGSRCKELMCVYTRNSKKAGAGGSRAG